MTKNTAEKLKKAFSALLLLSAFITQSTVFVNASDGNSTENFKKYLSERETAFSQKSETTSNVRIHNGTVSSVYGMGGVAAIPSLQGEEKAEFISSSLEFSKGFTRLELPDTTIAILSSGKGILDKSGAFYENANLETVIPSRNFLYIGDKAFYGAKSLRYFFFPYLTRQLGDYCFAYCESLPRVSIYGDTAIGDGAFAGCSILSEVYLSEKVTRVGLDAFLHTPFYASLTDEFGISGDILIRYNGDGGDVIIPEGVRVIADGVFAGRLSIKSVSFPKSISYIGNSAFRSCANLKDIFFEGENTEAPKNLTLGKDAFDGCTLSEESLSKTETLPVDARDIKITEENKKLLKSPKVSVISFIREHASPFLDAPEIPETPNTQHFRIPLGNYHWNVSSRLPSLKEASTSNLAGKYPVTE